MMGGDIVEKLDWGRHDSKFNNFSFFFLVSNFLVHHFFFNFYLVRFYIFYSEVPRHVYWWFFLLNVGRLVLKNMSMMKNIIGKVVLYFYVSYQLKFIYRFVQKKRKILVINDENNIFVILLWEILSLFVDGKNYDKFCCCYCGNENWTENVKSW